MMDCVVNVGKYLVVPKLKPQQGTSLVPVSFETEKCCPYQITKKAKLPGDIQWNQLPELLARFNAMTIPLHETLSLRLPTHPEPPHSRRTLWDIYQAIQKDGPLLIALSTIPISKAKHFPAASFAGLPPPAPSAQKSTCKDCHKKAYLWTKTSPCYGCGGLVCSGCYAQLYTPAPGGHLQRVKVCKACAQEPRFQDLLSALHGDVMHQVVDLLAPFHFVTLSRVSKHFYAFAHLPPYQTLHTRLALHAYFSSCAASKRIPEVLPSAPLDPHPTAGRAQRLLLLEVFVHYPDETTKQIFHHLPFLAHPSSTFAHLLHPFNVFMDFCGCRFASVYVERDSANPKRKRLDKVDTAIGEVWKKRGLPVDGGMISILNYNLLPY